MQKSNEATAGTIPQRSNEQRISSMFTQDCLWASGLLAVLWLLYAFVFYEVWPNTGDGDVGLALLISGGLVLLFNTASIVAMIRHYSDDKEHIYGLDLHYLDIMRRAKG
ncbi:MAG: hypothetical protein R3D30_13935 [Hyphomicrobiales bacterium]